MGNRKASASSEPCGLGRCPPLPKQQGQYRTKSPTVTGAQGTVFVQTSGSRGKGMFGPLGANFTCREDRLSFSVLATLPCCQGIDIPQVPQPSSAQSRLPGPGPRQPGSSGLSQAALTPAIKQLELGQSLKEIAFDCRQERAERERSES